MLKKRLLISLSVVSALAIGLTMTFGQPGGGRGQRGNRGGGGGDQGGNPGGGRGGRTFDPSRMFNYISGGKDFLDQNDINRMLQFSSRMDPNAKENLDRFMQQQGITNGVITRDQFTAYSQYAQQQRAAQAGNPGATPGGPPSGQMDEQRIKQSFDRRDRNRDGVIDLSELTGDNDQTLRDEFDKWDKNKNGKLEYDEYKEYFQARMQFRNDQRADQRGQNGQPGADQFQPPQKQEEKHVVFRRASDLPKELPAWFLQNAQQRRIVGQISLKEWRTEGKSVEDFRKYDRNLDGFITVEEVLAVERKKGTALTRRNSDQDAPEVAEPLEEEMIVFAGRGAIDEDTPIISVAMGDGTPGGFNRSQMGGNRGNRGGMSQMGGFNRGGQQMGGFNRGGGQQMGGFNRGGGQQNGGFTRGGGQQNGGGTRGGRGSRGGNRGGN